MDVVVLHDLKDVLDLHDPSPTSDDVLKEQKKTPQDEAADEAIKSYYSLFVKVQSGNVLKPTS